jgi:hypothetical protein
VERIRRDEPVKEQGREVDHFSTFARRAITWANDEFKNDLAVANVPQARRAELKAPVSNVHELINHLVSAAIEDGHVGQASVAKDDKLDVRDHAKAKAAAEWLYDDRKSWTRRAVSEWVKDRLQTARETAGLASPVAQDGEPDTAPGASDGVAVAAGATATAADNAEDEIPY